MILILCNSMHYDFNSLQFYALYDFNSLQFYALYDFNSLQFYALYDFNSLQFYALRFFILCNSMHYTILIICSSMLFVISILCNSMHYDFKSLQCGFILCNIIWNMYSDNCSWPIGEYSRPMAIRCVCKHTDCTANAIVLGAFHLVAWKLVAPTQLCWERFTW